MIAFTLIFCPTIFLRASSAGRSLPLFFCNQKKSRKTVKEKFLQPPPSRSRVRLPPKGGINAPPEAFGFLISTASPTGSRAVFQYPSDARPPEVLRTSRSYYFNAAVQNAYSARLLSRSWYDWKCTPFTLLKVGGAEKLSPFGRVHFQNMYAGAARYLVLFITLPGEYSVRR